MSAPTNKTVRYITVCPKCKIASTGSPDTCTRCNSTVIQTCVTVEQFYRYTQSPEDNDPILNMSMWLSSISESYLAPLDEIVANVRNDKLKTSKRVDAIEKLWIRKEREAYIPEIIRLLADPDLAGAAVCYLFVCTMSPDNKVYQYVTLKDLEGLRKLSRKTKLLSLAIPFQYVKELKNTILLKKYAAGESCSCEECGSQTKNVIIKIGPIRKLVSSERKRGNIIENLYRYSAEKEISVICDDCALKHMKGKRGKGKSDEELIKEYLYTNCIGGSLPSFTHLSGYNYEALIDLEHLPVYTPWGDFPQEAFNAMCIYAQEIKRELDER